MNSSQTSPNVPEIQTAKSLAVPVSLKLKAYELIRVIALSTTFWLVSTLVLTDVFITNVRPLRFTKITGVILQDQDPIVEEVQTIRSASSKTNTLLLGTSLLRNVTSFADAQSSGRELTVDGWNRYFNANTFDSSLQKNFGLNTKSLNIFVGGGFFYDSWLLLQEAVKSKNPPKFVVLTIAPKDFLDNTRPLSDSHVQISLNLRLQDNSSISNLPSAVDWIANKFWKFFRMRGEYHCVLETAACSIFNKAPNIYAATHEKITKRPDVKLTFEDEKILLNTPLPKEKQETLKAYYKTVYQSTSAKTLSQQLFFLNKALTLLKENNISVIVVGMPLSTTHAHIIPANLSREYTNRITETCMQSNVKLINLMEDKRFVTSDFHDLVHLTGKGSIKFWKILAEEMKNQNVISTNLVQALKSNKDGNK